MCGQYDNQAGCMELAYDRCVYLYIVEGRFECQLFQNLKLKNGQK